MLYPNPQIYHHIKTIFVHVPKAAGTSIERHLRLSDKDVVGGHTTAMAFRAKYPEVFDSYYKFSVVRHPVDRFVSAYSYLKEHPIHPALNNEVIHESGSLDRFVDMVRASPTILGNIVHLMPQSRFICDNEGKVLTDSVYRFENMEEAWKQICERIGITHAPLARLNPSHREALDQDSQDSLISLVTDYYKEDYARFSYGEYKM